MKRLRLSLALLLTLGATCARAAAPTRVSYAETASWSTTGASKSTASISFQTNDVLAVLALNEGGAGGGTFGTPTVTGATFTIQKFLKGTGALSGSMVACAVAASTTSAAVTVTNSNSANEWGFAVWVYRGSAGCGNSSEQHTTTKTVALTATAADAAIVWGLADFNADVAATAGTPTATTTNQKVQIASHYTIGVFDLTDQVSAGSVSYGFTGGGTVGPFSLVVLEIKASAGGGGSTPHKLSALGVGDGR